ncbi:alpha-ketoglutarate-dependent taurine dioxygenase [Stemphylium lycopersici]|uniref:Alpha-ketoglutarate-dependent taurine dioxygenase n=1 Tax=Stemphylium lycopersici TaxID=183478 RepID=A0A364MVL1_STELY|nr:alpha-ketoglutarate-dependent taurine dioxygenase [Stemphylium lycopersici]RAR05011.1 alpha-ketoglutarate-dependent taurine dioxygenase [Stemphylium lycopersici]
MAPALVETVPEQPNLDWKSGVGPYKEFGFGGPKVYQKDLELRGTEKHAPSKYPHYLPVWDNEKGQKLPPLESFTHTEHGKDADPTFSNLLQGAQVSDLTANIGAEVHGIQLSTLTNVQKDELALFVAQKKVVAFRDQDFADLSIKHALDIGGYFGRHHIHPTSGAPEGYPEVHLVHRGTDDTTARDYFEERTNSITWHSDVTYEKQPPGTTFLYLLDGPAAGGDTLFANQAAAYRRLSPEFRKRLHGLRVVHSAVEQAESSSNRGGIVRRDPVTSIHPLVRTHPATGEKALFVNPQFSRRIVGLKKEESEYLLNFLYDHIAKGQDFQARVKWAPGTVVVWDNRVTAHSALLDWDDGARRHLARITPQAEPPFETEFERERPAGFEY